MAGRYMFSGFSGITQMAKKLCRIRGNNEHLSDNEIAEVCKFIALCASDTRNVDGKVEYGEIGISLMLSIALYEFPDFYQRHELWQRN